VSNLFQDHLDAFSELLAADSLTWYDGQVPDGAPEQYVLLYTYFETPDGLAAPDAVDLTHLSRVLDARVYAHCVGSTPASARATAARVRALVLDETLVIPGRVCLRIGWREGQPPVRNEEIPGQPVHDQVDVYGWRSVSSD
jgi:hypothetical protein